MSRLSRFSKVEKVNDVDMIDFGMSLPRSNSIDRSSSIELIRSTSETRLSRSRSNSFIENPVVSLNESPENIARNQLREKLRIHFTETPKTMIPLKKVIDILNMISIKYFKGVFEIDHVTFTIHVNKTSFFAENIFPVIKKIVNNISKYDQEIQYTMDNIYFGFIVTKFE